MHAKRLAHSRYSTDGNGHFTRSSSCLPFAPMREEEMKGVLLVVGKLSPKPLRLV
jgi:hypothetical protein